MFGLLETIPLSFSEFRSRRQLLLENLALRHQITVPEDALFRFSKNGVHFRNLESLAADVGFGAFVKTQLGNDATSDLHVRAKSRRRQECADSGLAEVGIQNDEWRFVGVSKL